MLKFSEVITDEQAKVLSPEVSDFLKFLCIIFTERIEQCMAKRRNSIISGFDASTASIRESDWTVADVPEDILDRRVEITGPPSRKMVINALNSGAQVYMSDFEDSNAPTWINCINGQVNLKDAVDKKISFKNAKGRSYKLKKKTATLFVRPRGLHLKEKHVTFTNSDTGLTDYVPASLFDFGVYFANNFSKLISNGTRPYFYLPKLEHYREAELWNDIFSRSENYFNIPNGSIRATVLIETLPAAFQMHEILYALRNHSVGLNCGRWDYIFSTIKSVEKNTRLGAYEPFPDRDDIGMSDHFMRSYARLLIQTCHKRGAHAMGGMAAQIPIKDNKSANKAAMIKVRIDKEREVLDGHDGTWVAHPGLVKIARNIFDEHMPQPNQISTSKNMNRVISEQDLMTFPVGVCTRRMLEKNIKIGYKYIKAWLSGSGCVPLNNLMEDAATAEISRIQVWQWLRHNAILDTGEPVSPELVVSILESVAEDDDAKKLFKELCLQADADEFLTTSAYDILVGVR